MDRSGRRSTRAVASSCASTAPRSCSSTTAAPPSGSALRLNELAEEGDRARPPRLARARGAHGGGGAAEGGRDPVHRRDLEPRAGDRHGRGRSRAPGRVAQVGGRRTAAHRPRRATAWERSRKGRIFPKFRADLLECAVLVRRMREGAIEPTVVPRNPLDVLAQQIVAMAAAEEELAVEELYERVRAHPHLRGAPAPPARGRARHARRALPLQRVRRAASADRLGPPRRHDPPAQGRPRSSRSPTPARSPTAASTS